MIDPAEAEGGREERGATAAMGPRDFVTDFTAWLPAFSHARMHVHTQVRMCRYVGLIVTHACRRGSTHRADFHVEFASLCLCDVRNIV